MRFQPDVYINAATKVHAGYLVSRNLVLAVMLLAMLGCRARGPVRTIMVAVALVQFADAILDAIEGRLPLVPGVLVLGIAFLMGAVKLSNGPLLNSAWRTGRVGSMSFRLR